MTVRFWNALGWGVVAFWLSIEGLWAFTQKDVLEIIFLGIMVMLLVFGVVAWFTQPKPKKHEPQPLNPADCPIITLNKEKW